MLIQTITEQLPGTDLESRPSSRSPLGQRRAPRHHLIVEISYESEDNVYTGFTSNLSEGGLFIATYAPLPIGTSCTVELTLPGETEPINARCVVRWLREYNPASDAPPGMGVQFVEMDERGQEAIHAFMTERDPLFYVD
jgi:uncharacterized protein (TIGR02266 family)